MRPAKDELRQRMRDLRIALAPDEARRRSALAAPHLLALPEMAAAGRVALFAPVRNEIDTRPVHAALAPVALVCYPRVDGPTLSFAAVPDRDALVPGQLGIPEPPPDAAPVAA